MRHRPSIVVAVTREEAENGPLTAALRALGATVLHAPLLRTMPIAKARARLQSSLKSRSYRWIAITSARTVAASADIDWTPDVKIAAVGRATAAALRGRGLPVDLIAEHETGAGLAAALITMETKPARLLLPGSDRAGSALPDRLRAAGWHVDRIALYRTVPSFDAASALRSAIDAGTLDALTFASPSAVQAAIEALGRERWQRTVRHLVLGVIGPTTEAELMKFSPSHHLRAGETSFEALAKGVVTSLTRTAAA